MQFNSVQFILFFPAVALAYFALPHRARWAWLLAASYFFYMCWDPAYALLMLASTAITYASGLAIARTRGDAPEAPAGVAAAPASALSPAPGEPAGAAAAPSPAPRAARAWVAVSFAANLAILFFFKYFRFALANVNAALGALGLAPLDPGFSVLLPVGISFYTFQALSYTVDVYRGEAAPERHFGRYALFVSFFPQLVAGPIERSKHLLAQMGERHRFDFDRARDGLLLMLWGYFQKLVVADRLAGAVTQAYDNYQAYGGLQLAAATAMFAVQIYCDFSGYSAIAIGAAQVMGFRIMDNFRQPYFATSVRDFWRRWHVSLSTWFRDYLYIPLGGGRAGRAKKYRNVMATFLASGLWHGADWTFVLWGALHGAYQVAGDALRPMKDRATRALGVRQGAMSYRIGQSVVTCALTGFAWIFFRAGTIGDALGIASRVLTDPRPATLLGGSFLSFWPSGGDLWVAGAAVALLFCVGLWQASHPGETARAALARQNLPFRWLVGFAGVFAVLVFGVYGPGYDAGQFIYFQF